MQHLKNLREHTSRRCDQSAFMKLQLGTCCVPLRHFPTAGNLSCIYI